MPTSMIDASLLVGPGRETPHPAMPVLPRPNVFFDQRGLDALRRRLHEPALQRAFDKLQRTVDAWMTPGSDDYQDWLDHPLDPPFVGRYEGHQAVSMIEHTALLFALTGEAKYARYAQRIVSVIIDNKLADSQSTLEWEAFNEKDTYKGWRHVVGHDFGNFSAALALFYDVCHDAMSAAEREVFIAYALESLQFNLDYRAETGRNAMNNRGVRSAMGNALLALAIHPDRPDENLVRYAVYVAKRLAGAWATFALDRDGGSCEGVSYCVTSSVMMNFLGETLHRRGMRHLGLHPHLRSLPLLILYNLVPDRSQILPINDCSQSFFLYGLLGWARRGAYVGWDDHTVRLSWQLYNQLRDEGAFEAFDWPGNPFYELLINTFEPASEIEQSTAGQGSTQPGSMYPLGKHFRGHGVTAALSSWEPGAAQALFYSGSPCYIGHMQDDQNTFTFCAMGEKFAWDGGYDKLMGVYADRAYRHTENHNAILINGEGQTGYNSQFWPDGQVVQFTHNDQWTYSLGDAANCYSINGRIARCDRHLLLRRGSTPYLLVVDDVSLDERTPFDATWNFVAHHHTTLSAIDAAAGHYEVVGPKAGMDLKLLSDQLLAHQLDKAGNMPRLQATANGARVRFAALLLPRWIEGSSWQLHADFMADAADVRVSISGVVDSYKFDLRLRDEALLSGDQRVDLAATLG